MENGLTLRDLKLFIKLKKKIIFISTIVITLLIVAFSLFQEMRTTSDQEDFDGPIEEEISEIQDEEIRDLLLQSPEELSQNELEAINDYLFQDAFVFRLYIENVDGSIYNRTNLIEEILTSEQVIQLIEEQTGHELDLIKDHFLDVEYNSSNVSFAIVVGTGSVEANEEISNAYYNNIADDNVGVLNQKLIYFFEEPQLLENDSDIQDVETIDDSSENLLVTIILSVIIGLVLGLGFGLVIAFALSLLEKKINPLYNYNLKENNIFINFSGNNTEDLRKNELYHAISYPTHNKKLVLSQNYSTINKIKKLTSDSEIFNGVIKQNAFEVSPDYTFNEIIIITENGKTDKLWYEEQQNQIQVYMVPVKIIKL